MARQGTMKGMLNSSVESLTDAAVLADRFRVSQDRGAKHAADTGVDVTDIPAMVRQERAQTSEEEFAEAEEILAKSLDPRLRG